MPVMVVDPLVGVNLFNKKETLHLPAVPEFIC